AVRVVIHEALSEEFGLFIWPSGIALACLVWSLRARMREGVGVIEIGAGTSLPGLLAAKAGALGAHVTLTDREDSSAILDNICGAIEANGLKWPSPPRCRPGAGPTVSPGLGEEGSESGPQVERSANVEGGNESKGFGQGAGTGCCRAMGMSWGKISPPAMRLAAENPQPQVGKG
ncbi:unnamed protein product, partial [Discosporangium mesarthrocarpum]